MNMGTRFRVMVHVEDEVSLMTQKKIQNAGLPGYVMVEMTITTILVRVRNTRA
jgi:transcription antitermination factor NusG